MSDEPTTQTDEAIERLGLDYRVRAVFPGAELRSEDTTPTMFGHLAVFNEWTRVDSAIEGQFMERIAPGAFAKTLQENRRGVQVIYDHGQDMRFGRHPLGKIRELREEDRGVYYEVELLDTERTRELMPGLRAGLYGSSFRFRPVKATRSRYPTRSDYNPNGWEERTIKELEMIEFGPTPFPVYADATAGVRSVSMTDVLAVGRLAEDPEHLRTLLAQAGIALPTPEPAAATPTQSRAVTANPRRFHSDDEWLTYLQEMAAQ
jgi:HK97 family phage prohead protease